MCRGSWDCPCNGPEYDCDECSRKDIIIEECQRATKILFNELYMCDKPNADTIDWCMNELASYLEAVKEWPKDNNNEYIKLKLKDIA